MIRAAFALLLLLLAAGCERQEPSPAPAPSPARPALWAVADADGATRGWLFGTIHALPDDARWETPALAAALDRAGVLVVEVRDLDPERTAAVFARLARDEPVPPLAERLPLAQRAKLAELLDRENIPVGRLDGLETWAAALALARMAGDIPAGGGVDQALIARFAGRPIAELEGAQSQLAIFDRLPERDQRRLLAAVIAEGSDPGKDARALADAWLAGDLAQLEHAARRGLLADPALRQALATGRNAAWMETIAPLLDSGRRPMVAVGAAHMLGDQGLPALLAARGFTVRRIQ